MTLKHWFALVAVVVLAALLPVTAWFTADARAARSLKQEQFAGLQREFSRQQQAQTLFQQRQQFAQEVNRFVDQVAGYGLGSRGLSAYPVRFRERVGPESVAEELARLRGEPERFYVPHSFFYGREGLDLSSRQGRRLDTLSRVRQDDYLLTFQGHALVVNHDG